MSVQVPVYKCTARSRHMSRPSLQCLSPFCRQATFPSKKEKNWQTCRKKIVKVEGNGEASATKRKRLHGLRGVSLSEESRPGPSDLHVRSQNIRSWQAHGTDMLTHASDAKVQLVFLQEQNTHISIPTASHTCSRQRWQALIVRKRVEFNGGVAILCRESCGPNEVSRISSGSGQLIHAVLHGGQRDINFSVFTGITVMPICHFA